MTAFVGFVFSFSGFVVALLACVAWTVWRPASLRARRLLVGVTLAYALASLWPVPYAASRVLTRGYSPLPKAEVATGRTAIVLLGGGHEWIRDWDRMPLPINDPTTLSRMVEAARVFRMSGDAWVISSGGALGSIWPDSEVMRDVLIRQGVPTSRILLESESRTTRDEAVLIAEMLPKMQVDRVILVTSATHMRRSLAAFRAVGITAIPAIARDPVPAKDWEFWIRPNNRALQYSAAIIHEVLGMAFYAARGWYR